MNGGLRSLAKKLAWPAKRFFDPRFTLVLQEIESVKRIVGANADAANELATFTGRSLDTVLAYVETHRRTLDSVEARLDTMSAHLEQLSQRVAFDPESPYSVDESTAEVSTGASSHEGSAGQADRGFDASLVNVPYAFRALARVRPGARVLDVGATESSVCLSLATLGYDVTAVDPKPNPLSHERLRVIVARIEEWEQDAAFDAVLCLSTIEHIGTAASERQISDRRLDLEALKRIRDLTRPDGVLVLTAPIGRASIGKRGRVYDREALDELVEGWEIADLTLAQRRDATKWVTIDQPIEALEPEADTLAMITAIKAAV